MSEVGQDNMDAEVVLTVSGLFDADVQAAFTDTSAALKRGGTHGAGGSPRGFSSLKSLAVPLLPWSSGR